MTETSLKRSLQKSLAPGCNQVRWRPGQGASLAPVCSNLRSFGSKCTVLKKALVTLLRFFGARGIVTPLHRDVVGREWRSEVQIITVSYGSAIKQKQY